MPFPALFLAAALMSAGLPPVHVALAFGFEPAVPPAVATAAVREAAAIWSRYDVVVDRTMPCASAPDEAIVLTVRTRQTRTSGVQNAPIVLGAIDFADDGTPHSILTVFLDLLLRSFTHTRLGGVAEDRWPPELRQRVIGRALGRVIAHEIGHYLLGSRAHSSSGLMRAVQPFEELFGQSGAGFMLSRSDERHFAQSVVR
jgi:hypothetical protein